jgi:hypothetical protein
MSARPWSARGRPAKPAEQQAESLATEMPLVPAARTHGRGACARHGAPRSPGAGRRADAAPPARLRARWRRVHRQLTAAAAREILSARLKIPPRVRRGKTGLTDVTCSPVSARDIRPAEDPISEPRQAQADVRRALPAWSIPRPPHLTAPLTGRWRHRRFLVERSHPAEYRSGPRRARSRCLLCRRPATA